MWDPLSEPTPIPEMEQIHTELRRMYPTPSLELYFVYYARLHTISLNIPNQEFRAAVRAWRRTSVLVGNLESKLQQEVRILHSIYERTVLLPERTQSVLEQVDTFVQETSAGKDSYSAHFALCLQLERIHDASLFQQVDSAQHKLYKWLRDEQSKRTCIPIQ